MDAPDDDKKLGSENQDAFSDWPKPNEPLEPNNEIIDVTPLLDEPKGISLPSDEEILNKINNELIMADEKTLPETETGETKPKKTKDKEPTIPVVVKKDQTILILAIVALVVATGFFIWQNYQKKRKDEENTIDGKFADLSKEQEKGYNEQNQYE